MSLYRKYRPQTFSEIVDQEPIVHSLLKQLETGKPTHAYLFSGPRGTGKTSTARIFAKAINCEKHKEGKFGEPCNKCDTCVSITQGRNMDVMEIDAASNRGIDEIRDLREKVKLAPTSATYKVYIIDEAHQLTNEAFNALLKTLEEPPEHVIFILATTEVHKIPATIASRTQKYEFRLSEKTSEKYIKFEEAKALPKESLELIARYSGGSFRDGEVLLEKVVTVNPKATPEEIEKILGKHLIHGIDPFNSILQKDTKAAVLWLAGYPGDYKVLAEELVETLRNVLLVKIGVLEESNAISPKKLSLLKEFSQQISADKLQKWIKLFSEAIVEMKDSPIPSLPLELAIVEACEFNDGSVVEAQPSVAKEPSIETKVEKKVEPVAEKVEKVVEQPKKEKVPEVTMKDAAKIDEVKKNWSEILKKIKAENSSLGVFMRNAVPAEVDDGLLTLEVYYQFHKDLVEEPKNSGIIATAIEEVVGRPVRIKGRVSEKAPPIVEKKVEKLEELDPADMFGKLN
ncbi:MAG TPA: DNA polymerase III subunit gamma/tau [Candidatus Saccharimonadales bacterium]|nr:DNA polymerase III subunit gamma/tau [Candidatus Saccharimonadales bacterium]